MELQREALIDVAMGYASADTVITKGLAYMTQDRFELAELFVDEAA